MANDALQPLGPDIWMVDGPAIRFYGIPFPTRMTVIRLGDGDLFLHSPIRYSPKLAGRLSELGRIRHLVSPNWIHYAHLGDWAHALSDAVTWAASGVRDRARSRGAEIRFDRDLSDTPPPDWAGQIDQILVTGPAHSEVVFFHERSRVLILTDLIENMDRRKLPLWVRPLARLGGVLAPHGKVPLDMWLSFAGHRDRLAIALGRMLDWHPATVVLAHGDILRENTSQRLREGFRNLAPMRPGH